MGWSYLGSAVWDIIFHLVAYIFSVVSVCKTISLEDMPAKYLDVIAPPLKLLDGVNFM